MHSLPSAGRRQRDQTGPLHRGRHGCHQLPLCHLLQPLCHLPPLLSSANRWQRGWAHNGAPPVGTSLSPLLPTSLPHSPVSPPRAARTTTTAPPPPGPRPPPSLRPPPPRPPSRTLASPPVCNRRPPRRPLAAGPLAAPTPAPRDRPGPLAAPPPRPPRRAAAILQRRRSCCLRRREELVVARPGSGRSSEQGFNRGASEDVETEASTALLATLGDAVPVLVWEFYMERYRPGDSDGRGAVFRACGAQWIVRRRRCIHGSGNSSAPPVGSLVPDDFRASFLFLEFN